MRFKESRQRSLVKSFTFRALIVLTDLAIVYALTRRVFDTVAITVFTNAASTIFYFLHERFWNAIAWGRQRLR